MVSIFEVGFGTGLNALLTVKAMQTENSFGQVCFG